MIVIKLFVCKYARINTRCQKHWRLGRRRKTFNRRRNMILHRHSRFRRTHVTTLAMNHNNVWLKSITIHIIIHDDNNLFFKKMTSQPHKVSMDNQKRTCNSGNEHVQFKTLPVKISFKGFDCWTQG